MLNKKKVYTKKNIAKKAPERIPFVRLMMMQTKQKRKNYNISLGIESV